MALIGNPFEDFVKNQVEIRQSTLGAGLFGNRSLDGTKAFNLSSPWIRLTSGVRITDSGEPGSVYKQLEAKNYLDKGDWDGDALSKNLILTGGATNDKGEFFSGLGGPNASMLQKAYGYGGNTVNGQGYIPMPGITSCDFEYKNDGALAFASIKVKAFSKEQFQLLDILYQRPGYTCLLEFGHTAFLDNSGNIQYAGKGDYNFNTRPFQKIFSSPGKDNNFYNMAQDIESERKKWYGNYEAFFGRVTKFNWKFQTDGSYDMEIKLVGTGDVISSLQVNVPKALATPFTFKFGSGSLKSSDIKKVLEARAPSEKDKEEAKEEGATVIADAMASQLNFELFCMFLDSTSFPKDAVRDFTIKDFPHVNSAGKSVQGSITIPRGVYKANVAGITVDYDPNTWIKFSALLAMIQKICNIKDEKGDSYLLNFDLNWENLEEDTTFMATFPGNFAANPNKVLAEYVSYPAQTGITLTTSTRLNNAIKTGKFNNKELGTDVNPQFYRRLADIYINVNFITNTLNELRGGDPEADDEVEIVLLDFLKKILETVNTQLGGINNFRVVFNDKTNTISIVSQTPLISKQEEAQKVTTINTFGLENGLGSFVKSLDLNSELTDKMANQITMAAQEKEKDSKGSGVDGTSFSSYNGGLTDRLFVKKKTALDDAIEEGKEEADKEKTYYEQVWDDNTIEAFREIYQDVDFDGEYVQAMENIVSGLAKRVIADMTTKKPVAQAQATFFLPFNLGVTMHGLSGIKIFQSFQTTGRELPLSYNPALISLIIKSYSHSVTVDGWTTKIETFAKPLKKVDSAELGLSTPRAPNPIPPPPPKNEATPRVEGEGGQTIPSGYPVGKIYYQGPTTKTQIYLHHTAGWQNIQRVVNGFNKRTDHVATHIVSNNSGQAEQLFPDETWAYHLGIEERTFKKVGAAYQNLNKISLGIEMCSIGPLKLKRGKYYCYPDDYTTLFNPEKENAGAIEQIVDKNNKASTYKGHSYCEGFTEAHRAKVFTIVRNWSSKYGIPLVYDFDACFPAKGTVVKAALLGTPGIYTHNSVKTTKLDIMPTTNNLALLKALAT